MRGLSILQPWASLIAIGAKRLETRSWPTQYRGEVLIHASKRMKADDRWLCQVEPFRSALSDAGIHDPGDLQAGVVLAVAVIEDVIRTEVQFRAWELDRWPLGARRECQFGNYAPGRVAWSLKNVRRLPTPIPCRGDLGLWPVSQTLLDLVAGQGVI